MILRRLRLKDYVKKGRSHHFARLQLDEVQLANRHSHDFPELFWVEEGEGVHVVSGERRLIRAGTLIFVRPEEVHTVGARQGGGRFLICNMALRPELWAEFRRRYRSAVAEWFRPGLPALRQRQVGANVLDFLRAAGLELIVAPRTGFFLERFLLNLAFALRGLEETAAAVPDWLRAAAERVEQEKLFRHGAGGHWLAQIAQRSPAHVAREVRRHLGKTPTDWVNEMRMRHAAQLLAGTRREILDICADCGFENVGHFYALFRKQYGMPPLAWRRRSDRIVRPEK
jgi:AraC family cel operon transcriptional repressor